MVREPRRAARFDSGGKKIHNARFDKVVLNGQQVIDADLDRWTTPHKNPDGSQNKYNKPLKDFPRSGYIGLQDHGHDVWFKNIKVKPIK